MKTKKLLTTTALTTMLVVGSMTGKVYSQAKNFEGPYISIGASYSTTESEIENDTVTGISSTTAYSSSATMKAAYVGFNSSANQLINRVAQKLNGSTNGNIVPTGSLGYNFLLDNNFLMGVELSYSDKGDNFTKNQSYNSGALTEDASSYAVTVTAGTNSVKINDKESMSLSLKPSYVVGPNTLFYGKASYSQLKKQADVKFSLDSASNYSKSKTLDGYGLGIGITHLVDKNFFVDFGVSGTKYSDFSLSQTDSGRTTATTTAAVDINSTTHSMKTTIKDNLVYDATIKIGYKF
jgi:opacity protein-like surface antigen